MHPRAYLKSEKMHHSTGNRIGNLSDLSPGFKPEDPHRGETKPKYSRSPYNSRELPKFRHRGSSSYRKSDPYKYDNYSPSPGLETSDWSEDSHEIRDEINRLSSLPSNNDNDGRCDNDEVKIGIPKIIMQTWKDRNIPEKWKNSPKSIQEKMPGWKYVLMTDEDNRNFVEEHFPDFLPYYDSFPHAIQRADAIRACWLYVHGGIYIDLDFVVLKPLDPLFVTNNEVYVVPSGNISSTITNSFMASKPKCELWLIYIEEMKKKSPFWAYGKHLLVMSTTGPICFSRSIKKWEGVVGHLPSKSVMPCSVCGDNCDLTDAYLEPLDGKSWCAADSHFYNYWLCHWKQAITGIVIILIVIIVFLLLWWFNWFDRPFYW